MSRSRSSSRRARSRRRTRFLDRLKGAAGMLVLVAAMGFFARMALAGLSGAADFTVEEIRVEGTRFLEGAELLALTRTVQVRGAKMGPEDMEGLGARVAQHPLVERVAVRRSLPASVIIEVTERVPAALLEGTPVRGVDASGRELEGLDPARYGSLPFITGLPEGRGEARERALTKSTRAIETVRASAPRLLDRVSEVRPGPDGAITLVLLPDAVEVLLRSSDLSRTLPLVGALVEEGRERHAPLAQVDLRYEETVIYRERKGGD
ncbi:MAG: FtsQ-type POTRA domain-containing protein [bacterium]